MKNLNDNSRIIGRYVNPVLGGKHSYQGPIFKLHLTSRYRHSMSGSCKLWISHILYVVANIFGCVLMQCVFEYVPTERCKWYIMFAFNKIWFLSQGLDPETLKFQNGLYVYQQCELNFAFDAIVSFGHAHCSSVPQILYVRSFIHLCKQI